MKITKDSHTDHGLSAAHIDLILKLFGDRTEFFIETVELPATLVSLPCGLHGPATGSAPVSDSECFSEVRGNRAGPSRLCNRPVKPSRFMTVIGGPHEGECILYTACGGPVAPREPWESSLDDAGRVESTAFWAQHALSKS